MQSWPAWRYDPETEEGRVFENEADVPDGWVDRLGEGGTPKVKAAKAKPAPAPTDEPTPPAGSATPGEPEPMTRKEITSALDAGGISYKVNAKTVDLAELLRAKVVEFLTKRNTEFDPAADTRDLLAKLN